MKTTHGIDQRFPAFRGYATDFFGAIAEGYGFLQGYGVERPEVDDPSAHWISFFVHNMGSDRPAR